MRPIFLRWKTGLVGVDAHRYVVRMWVGEDQVIVIASEPWTTVGTWVAAVAGLGAVIVAVWTAVGARRDAKIARAEAAVANARLAETHRAVNAEQLAAARRARIEEAARRGPALVQVSSTWGEREPDMPWTRITLRVDNRGPGEIRDVVGWYDPTWHPGDSPRSAESANLRFELDRIPAHGRRIVDEPLPTDDHERGSELGFVIEFSDWLGDRWRLDQIGDLTLVSPRKIHIDGE